MTAALMPLASRRAVVKMVFMADIVLVFMCLMMLVWL